jgi:hypothetical protein
MVIAIVFVTIYDYQHSLSYNHQKHNRINLPQSRGIVAGGEGELVHGGPSQRLQLWQEVLQTNKKLFNGSVADIDPEGL